MTMLRKLSAAVRGFRDDRGVSAVEFALILPVLVMLYLGCVEVSLAVTVDRKVTSAGSVVGDLIAQGEELCSADIDNIFDATDAVLAPYDTTPLKVVVSYVEVGEDDTTVKWSKASNATPRTTGSTVTLPEEVAVEGDKLVLAEVEYLYKPTFGQTLKKNITFSDTFYMRPRNPNGIKLKSGC